MTSSISQTGRIARTVSVLALSAAAVLAGGAASGDEDERLGGTSGPPARQTAPEFDPGGIDGEALRQRMLAKPSGRLAPGARDARIRGRLSTQSPPPMTLEPSAEDDGAIPLARDLQLGADLRAIRTTGRIGDGPHGAAGGGTGDYDFYQVRASAGETVTVDVSPEAPLAPHVLLYDSSGDLVIGAAAVTASGRAFISHPVDRTDAYFVAVGNYTPNDPFDPASGPAVITEGSYTLDVALLTREMADTDTHPIKARRGDVIGATVRGAARRLAILDERGRTVQAAAADPGAIYPKRSPLPRGGRATVNHVVARTGTYFLSVSDGTGRYSIDAGTFRPEQTARADRQTILLDFTGPTFDNRVFGAALTKPGIRSVSPMRSYLPRWGLDRSDEKDVIEATTRRIRQIVKRDIPGSRVRIVTSLQRPELFGRPGVSRVIIGGSPKQAGLIDALGMSESVDPGNFVREETAIVMPALMAKDGHPLSLSPFLTRDSDRVRAVGQALGNVAGHEIGHFLGNFHTDDHVEHTSVMNTGYEYHFFAAGPDGVAGTKDDDRIGMRTTAYDRLQGLLGLEHTRWRTQVALR